MSIYSLYIKTHNQTGLKYLGRTIKEDVCNYRGSGKHWIRHIKKHGYDVTTDILSRCKTLEELECCGLFFSKMFDVVASPEWANLIPESGDGWQGIHSEETKKKFSETRKGMKFPNRKSSGPHSEERKAKLSLALNGKPQGSRGPMSEENKLKRSHSYKSLGVKRGPMSEEHKAKLRGPRGPYNYGVK